jgi:hypothetical protein
MAYYVFIDESGDHSLKKVDISYPLLLVCGSIFHSSNYKPFDILFNNIKDKYCNHNRLVFHSVDIRKAKKEFSFLNNKETLAEFIEDINHAVTNSKFTIIASYINKLAPIDRAMLKINDAYHLAMGFILERLIFHLDNCLPIRQTIFLIFECRDPKQDKRLRLYCESILKNGTFYLPPSRFKKWKFEILFRRKAQNINGLQLSDLLAYPIAQKVYKPENSNPAYDILECKFYRNRETIYGLKVYP